MSGQRADHIAGAVVGHVLEHKLQLSLVAGLALLTTTTSPRIRSRPTGRAGMSRSANSTRDQVLRSRYGLKSPRTLCLG